MKKKVLKEPLESFLDFFLEEILEENLKEIFETVSGTRPGEIHRNPQQTLEKNFLVVSVEETVKRKQYELTEEFPLKSYNYFNSKNCSIL